MDQEPAAYTPNHIPFGTRVFYLLVGLALLAYGSYGLWIDDIFLPAKRGPGTHMHGPPPWRWRQPWLWPQSTCCR